MPTFEDKEFGRVIVRRSSQARSMKASIAPTGELRVSLPAYMPIFMAKRMIASARNDIRKLLATKPTLVIEDGMPIGKSHTLHIRSGSTYSLKRTRQQVILTLTNEADITKQATVADVRSMVLKILRLEAKHHLPKRLDYLANQHGFSYSALRFTHASSRWGSCNQHKAISLNIALMKLPFELIDYVLLHELAHTKHLNHSTDFWDEVARVDSNYKIHRKQLKNYSPHV